MRFIAVLICLLKLIWICRAEHECNGCTGSRVTVLENCTFSATTAQVLNQCSSVEVLAVEFVVLPVFHLTEQLKKINILNCNTTGVVIDPTGSYEIEKLAVEKNSLRSLPRNLRVLNKLKKLNFAFNLIECVDMAELTGLSNLEEINLSDNRIVQICSSPFDPPVLPNLDRVYLQRNNLVTLNLENWKTPNVMLMYLNHNELSIVHKLAVSLPKLESLYIYENPLNCEWWNSTMNKIKQHCSFSPNMLESCNQEAEPIDKLMKEVETSSKVPTTDQQCHFNSSQSLDQILVQVQQLRQQVVALETSNPESNETLSQLQQTCFYQRTELRELVTEVESTANHRQVTQTTHPKPRKDCRCGLRAQAKLFGRQLGQLEQVMAKFGLKLQG